MFNTAKKFSLSFPIVVLRYVLSFFKAEKLCLASQVVAQCLLSTVYCLALQTWTFLKLLKKLSNFSDLRVRFAPDLLKRFIVSEMLFKFVLQKIVFLNVFQTNGAFYI